MKATVCIFAALVLTAFAQKIGDDCMTDGDCMDGCCMMMDGKMKCHMKAMKGELCNRMGMAMDACMCQGDMMCMQDSTVDTKYGKCMSM